MSALHLSRENVSVTCSRSEVILAHGAKRADGERLAVMLLPPLRSRCYNSFLTRRRGETTRISPEVFLH